MKIVFSFFIKVEKYLSGRLEAGLKSWTECLKGSKTSRHMMDDTDTSLMAHKPGGDPEIQVCILLLLLSSFFYFCICLVLCSLRKLDSVCSGR